MKRKLLSLVAVAMAGVLLVACNTSKPAQNTNDGGNENPKVEAQAGALDNSYLILVVDENDNPVSDVTVQFCNDVQCKLGTTSEDGVAVFESENPGEFSVHILDAPAGYTADAETEYTTDSNYGQLKVVLKGSAENTEKVYNFATAGFKFAALPDMENTFGTIEKVDFGSDDDTPGIVTGRLDYIGRSKEECDAIQKKLDNLDRTDEAAVNAFLEEYNKFYNVIQGPALYVIGVDTTKGVTIENALKNEYVDPQGYICETYDLGTAKDYTYYVCKIDYDKYIKEFDGAEMPEEAVKELKTFMVDTDLKTFADRITLEGPMDDISVDNGSVINFEVTDFDGNTMNLTDLCADHKVTMINVWGTWCKWCVAELPDLEELNKEFEAQGCQIVGLCEDGWKEGKADKATQQLKDAGVTYINVIAPESYHDYISISGYPTSFFVDSKGNVLTKKPVVGSDLEGYKAALQEALANLQ